MFNSWKSGNDFTQRSRIKGKQYGTQHRTLWYTTLESCTFWQRFINLNGLWLIREVRWKASQIRIPHSEPCLWVNSPGIIGQLYQRPQKGPVEQQLLLCFQPCLFRSIFCFQLAGSLFSLKDYELITFFFFFSFFFV